MVRWDSTPYLRLAKGEKKRPGAWPGLWCVFFFGKLAKLVLHRAAELLRLVRGQLDWAFPLDILPGTVHGRCRL